MAAKFDAVLDDIRKFTKVVHEAQQKQPQRQQQQFSTPTATSVPLEPVSN